MSEKPIIFSGPMVRAILDDRKHKTRRLNGLEKVNESPDDWVLHSVSSATASNPGRLCAIFTQQHGLGSQSCKSRYQPGDLLWVREKHAIGRPAHSSGAGIILPEKHPAPGMKVLYAADEPGHVPPIPWKPSINMPRWAARIHLRVTDVRVERVQDISEEDAKAEGAEPYTYEVGLYPSPGKCKGKRTSTHREAFIRLWNSIHGPGAWAINQWVWVISFEREK